jgi:hypothetical protein
MEARGRGRGYRGRRQPGSGGGTHGGAPGRGVDEARGEGAWTSDRAVVRDEAGTRPSRRQRAAASDDEDDDDQAPGPKSHDDEDEDEDEDSNEYYTDDEDSEAPKKNATTATKTRREPTEPDAAQSRRGPRSFVPAERDVSSRSSSAPAKAAPESEVEVVDFDPARNRPTPASSGSAKRAEAVHVPQRNGSANQAPANGKRAGPTTPQARSAPAPRAGVPPGERPAFVNEAQAQPSTRTVAPSNVGSTTILCISDTRGWSFACFSFLVVSSGASLFIDVANTLQVGSTLSIAWSMRLGRTT